MDPTMIIVGLVSLNILIILGIIIVVLKKRKRHWQSVYTYEKSMADIRKTYKKK